MSRKSICHLRRSRRKRSNRRFIIGYLKFYVDISPYYYIAAAVMFVGVLILARRLDWVRRIALSLLIPYLFLTLVATVITRSPTAEVRIVLEPFRTYRQYYTDEFTWFEIRANVLLFIPIGFLLPMVIKKPVWLPHIIGIGISVIIELIQLITHRGLCETDDVLSNSIGFLIGFAFFWLIKGLVLLIMHAVSTHKPPQ